MVMYQELYLPIDNYIIYKNKHIIIQSTKKGGKNMLELRDSDIFKKYANKNNVLFGKIGLILADPTTPILNDILYPEIKKKIVDKKKDVMAAKMAGAVNNKEILLFITPPEKRLPGLMPFFTFKQNGIRKVALNLTDLVIVRREPTGEVEYDISNSINKLYPLLYAAYLTLENLESNTTLSPDALYYSAVLWAEMFNKPVYDVVGQNNNDRRRAFMYFAIRFFLGYYMQCPEQQIDSLSMKYINRWQPEKNQFITGMEDRIAERDINIYAGFTTFCRTLFNNEITLIKGIRVNNLEAAMNVNFYIQRFIQTYSENALLSLCAYPYFVYTLIAATIKSDLVKHKSFERIFKDEATMVNKLLIALLK